MRDQGDFKSGVKHFAYDGGKSTKNNAAGEDWETFTAQKPTKKTKELDELQDTWSIQKNVSLSGTSLKPQGNTVQAPPTGTGFYSRHGQHSSVKISDGLRGSPGMNSQGQLRNSYSLGSPRSGYSYSQPEPQSSVTKLPLLSPAQGASQYQAPTSRYGEPAPPAGNARQPPGGGVKSPRTQLGMQKPNQHFTGSQHPSGNSKTPGTGSQWPNF